MKGKTVPRGKKNPDRLSAVAIGERLRITREALRHTQASIATLAEMTPQGWNNCERGADRIGLNAALRLCVVLAEHGVGLDWIYRGIITKEMSEPLVREIAQLQQLNRPSKTSPHRTAGENPRQAAE